MRRLEYLFLAAVSAVVFFLTGCSTIVNSHRQKAPMMADYVAGRNSEAMSLVTVKLTPMDQLPFMDKADSVVGTGDEVMWRLEAGSLNFNMANYAASIEQFKLAEELIAAYDERATVSLRDAASEATMTFTNLNALPYRGLCRDRIALSIYKSLAYLGAGNESAFRAQLRRLRDEQKKVMEDYKKFFEEAEAENKAVKAQNPEAARQAEEDGSAADMLNNPENGEFRDGVKLVKEVAHRGYGGFLNPAAIFLSGLGSVRDDNFENARIDFQRLYEAMPTNPMIQRYYVSVLEAAGRPVPDGLRKVKAFDFPLDRDCVYVIFANGISGALKQIAVYFPVMTAWPMCEFYPAPYRFLRVGAGGKSYDTVMLADMDGILAQEFDERLPGMITRIVLSTAVKEAGKYAATYAASREDAFAGIGVYIGTSIYTALMNTADTRSWEILPKEFQLTQFPMPADRVVTVGFDGAGAPAKSLKLPEECRSAIIFVNAPGKNVVTYQIFPLKSK